MELTESAHTKMKMLFSEIMTALKSLPKTRKLFLELLLSNPFQSLFRLINLDSRLIKREYSQDFAVISLIMVF